ncbi:MAG: hypothetical protein RLZZ46_1302 [Bacteroidota bacterium]
MDSEKETRLPQTDFWAKILSTVFHPVFSPTLCLAIILSSTGFSLFQISTTQKILLISLIFLNTAILPALFSFLLVKFGFISSLQMQASRERFWPYFITTAFYLFTYLLLQDANLPQIIYNLQLGGITAILITALINIKWKISAHMTGMGGLSAMCLNSTISHGQGGVLIGVFVLLLSGLIGTCRVQLKAHSFSQIIAGWINGFCSLTLFI